jgi:hypothetical protein
MVDSWGTGGKDDLTRDALVEILGVEVLTR